MKYFSAALLILAGLVGLAISGFNVSEMDRFGLTMFISPLGWVAFGVLLIFLHRNAAAKDGLIAAKDKHIRNLGEMVASHQTDNENLERNAGHLNDRLKSLQRSHDNLEVTNNNNLTIVRRLNRILSDNGIDATAANIPPAPAGRELNSARVARENPTPPPRLSDSLRPDVVRSERRPMASPNPSSSPVHHHDNDSGLGTGLMMGYLLSDSGPTHRSAPEPTRCEPAPSYSEPTRSDPSPSYDPPSSNDYGGGGGGGGGCD